MELDIRHSIVKPMPTEPPSKRLVVNRLHLFIISVANLHGSHAIAFGAGRLS